MTMEFLYTAKEKCPLSLSLFSLQNAIQENRRSQKGTLLYDFEFLKIHLLRK